MEKTIDLKDAQCTSFSLLAPVQFASEEEKKGEFVIEAYTGEVVDRYWGKLAVSVDGMKAKKNMPILRDHTSSLIVGYSNKNWKDSSFFVSGKFSGVTDTAKEVSALAGEGFPWQASIGVRPLKIMSIEDGGKMEVNGKTLHGPAEVWLESEVLEVSFVPLGADGRTSVSVFSNFEEKAPAAIGLDGADHKRSVKMKVTLEELAKDAPELLSQIREAAKAEGLAAGAESERMRIKAVSEQLMAGHESLITNLMYDGKTSGPEAAVQVLQAEKKIRGAAVQALQADAIAPVAHVVPKETPEKKTVVHTKESFASDDALVEEFGDFDTYSAYQSANKKGLVRVLKNKEE